MRNVYLVGMMGSGKSYWGRRLAAMLGYQMLDLDEAITLQEGKSIPEIFEQQGERTFREIESKTLTGLSAKQQLVVSTGGGTPCFGHNMELMLQSGITIWLNPPVKEMAQRIWPARERRPLIAAATSEEEVEKILQQLLEKRSPFYRRAHITITDIDIDMDALASRIKSLD